MTANLIEILITGRDLAGPVIDGAAKRAKGLGGVLGEVGKVSTEALGAIAVESVRMATQYESDTERLVTSAGESQSAVRDSSGKIVGGLDMVRQAMLDMAGQVGVPADDLAKAMYYVESASFHGADGLKVLKAAAQGAAAEGADTTTVVKAMTDVLVDYHLGADQAAKVTSQMITAVSFGKTSLQDFSGAFASIVPAASAAGISFDDVAGALAEMTNHGFTANRASQNLAQALRSLLNPTGTMKTAFTEYGVSSDELRAKLNGPNGLTDAMEYLAQKATKAGKEGTPAFAAALKLLMGTAPGANAALATVGENFDATSKAIKGIGGATTDAQGNVQGFAQIQGTLGQKSKELRASLDTLMIEIGDKLIPVVKDVADWMLKHKDAAIILTGAVLVLGPVILAVSLASKAAAGATALWSAATKIAQGVMWLFNDACLGTRIGLVALTVAQVAQSAASKAAAAAQWLFTAALDASPVILLIGALAALGFGIYELVTHWKTVWGDIKKWAEDAWHFIYDGFGKYLLVLLGPVGLIALGVIELAKHWKQVWGDIKQVGLDFKQWLWDDFGAKIADFFTDTIPRWFDTAVRDVKGAWNAVYDAIFAPVKRAYDDVMKWVNDLITTIESLPGKAASAAASAGSSLLHAGGDLNPLNWFHAVGGIAGAAAGGPQGSLVRMNEQGGELVRLPTGSTVMPHANSVTMLAGGGGGVARVQLEWVGDRGGDEFFTWLRKNIRVRAGNAPDSVQKALGQSF